MSNSKNPFAWDSTSSKVKSKVMTMELKNSTGHPIKVSNLSKPIDMWVPRGLSVNFSLYTAKHEKMLYRAFPVVENDTSIQVEILAEDNNTELIAYLRYEKFPTEEFHDFKYVLPRRVFPVEPTGNMSQSNKTNTREINPYILFRSNEDLNRTAAGKVRCFVYLKKSAGLFSPFPHCLALVREVQSSELDTCMAFSKPVDPCTLGNRIQFPYNLRNNLRFKNLANFSTIPLVCMFSFPFFCVPKMLSK